MRSEAVARASVSAHRNHTRQAGGRETILLAIAWRNLWRSGRRSALTIAGIGFSIFLMVVAWSTQVGTFGMMFENATALLSGHIQIMHPQSIDDPSLRHTLRGTSELVTRISQHPEVLAVSLRAHTFGLISADERSFGGQVMGVEPAVEQSLSTLATRVIRGRYLRGEREAVLGTLLARNLGLSVGDEVVVLGANREGGVAALSARVVGIFQTDIAALDRSLMQVPLADFSQGFELDDEAHTLVVKLRDLDSADTVARELRQRGDLTTGSERLAIRPWSELLPDLRQLADMKMAGQQVFFVLLGIMVTFTTFNTFAMTVYERTREFGMLLALGMRPGSIIGLLQLEAAMLCLLGIAAGLTASIGLVFWLAQVGIPLGDELGNMMQQYQLPARFYPKLTVGAVLPPSILMFLALQSAALIPSLRVRGLSPASAMRADA